MGYSLHGIHKDELEMELGDFPIKREGSQGQNKTYLIAQRCGYDDPNYFSYVFKRHFGATPTKYRSEGK